MHRIIGENVYHKLISEEDKDGIISATSDWRKDGAGQNVRKFEGGIFQQWLDQNAAVADNMIKNPLTPGSSPGNSSFFGIITQGTYLKSDDTFIGFSRSRFLEEGVFENELVCFVPEYRGNSYLTESSILGLKTLFITFNANTLISKVTVDKSSSSIPSTTKESDDIETKLDRIEPVTHKKTILTQEEFLTWLNKPENEDIKNATYEYHWNYTE